MPLSADVGDQVRDVPLASTPKPGDRWRLLNGLHVLGENHYHEWVPVGMLTYKLTDGCAPGPGIVIACACGSWWLEPIEVASWRIGAPWNRASPPPSRWDADAASPQPEFGEVERPPW